MTDADRFFELPDAAVLVLTLDEASPAVVDELETWSLVVGEQGPPEATRDPSVWGDLFSAGPLVVATVEGVIGNAAWSAFPAAARWLAGRRGRSRTLDAAGASARAVAAVVAVAGVSDSDVVVGEVARESSGGWRVRAVLTDGRHVVARLDDTGTAVEVRVH